MPESITIAYQRLANAPYLPAHGVEITGLNNDLVISFWVYNHGTPLPQEAETTSSGTFTPSPVEIPKVLQRHIVASVVMSKENAQQLVETITTLT